MGLVVSEQLFFSVIVIIKNNFHLSYTSFSSLAQQQHKNFETIVVIQNPTSMNSERLGKYYPQIDKIIYCDKKATISTMMNEGIKNSSGKFIQFLAPGSYFTSSNGLRHMQDNILLSIKNLAHPPFQEIFFSASLCRDVLPPKYYLHEFTIANICQGIVPTRFIAMFFAKTLFNDIGLFNTSYRYAPEFEFICRVLNTKKYVVAQKRVFVDFDYNKTSATMLLKRNYDIFRSIKQHFGIQKGLTFLFLITSTDVFYFIKSCIKEMFVAPKVQ